MVVAISLVVGHIEVVLVVRMMDICIVVVYLIVIKMRKKKKKTYHWEELKTHLKPPFFPFLFLDLVIVTLWALFFWFLDVLSDCSDHCDEKKNYLGPKQQIYHCLGPFSCRCCGNIVLVLVRAVGGRGCLCHLVQVVGEKESILLSKGSMSLEISTENKGKIYEVQDHKFIMRHMMHVCFKIDRFYGGCES